jgi:hypothetical protein
MSRIKVCLLACVLMLLSVSTFAVDGVTLISQATVNAAGGFPYTISQSGSYRLSSNLTVTTVGTSAIVINADNVVLDLNGFTVAGLAGSGPGNGIFGFGHQNITVKNGVVTGWNLGIRLIANGDVNALVEEVHASNNNFGISVGDGIVRRCTATGNSSVGITVTSGVVESNVSSSNLNGFLLGDGVTATGNSARLNTHVGLLAGQTVFGSNVFIGNGVDILFSTNSTSQNNNVCTGGGTC